MFVLVTSISVPDFMLVSKKAQFTCNLELSHLNINYFVNHDYSKILKSDWPSTVLISALKDSSTHHASFNDP